MARASRHIHLGPRHLFPQAACLAWEGSMAAGRLVSEVSVVAGGASAEAVHSPGVPPGRSRREKSRVGGGKGLPGRAGARRIAAGSGDGGGGEFAWRARLAEGGVGEGRVREGLRAEGAGACVLAPPRREGAEPLGGLSPPRVRRGASLN